MADSGCSLLGLVIFLCDADCLIVRTLEFRIPIHAVVFPHLPSSRWGWFGSDHRCRLHNESIVRNQVLPEIRNLDYSTRTSRDLIYLDQILFPPDEHRGFAAIWQLITGHFVFVPKYYDPVNRRAIGKIVAAYFCAISSDKNTRL